MKYKAVLFDLDGTLLDTSAGILAAVQDTIEKCGLKPLTKEEILTFIGPPAEASFQRIYGLQGEPLKRITKYFRNQYREEKNLLLARPYDGIYKVCNSLRREDVKVGIATYKRHDYTMTLLKYFEFDRCSDVIYGSDAESKLTKADIIELCLRDLDVFDYSGALMIGDTSHDALGAKALGIDFLGVTYGFGFHDAKDVKEYPAVGSVDRAEEILKYIV